MSDIFSEELISLAEAAKHLPLRRGGRPAHISCLYRWSSAGCKGIRLETVQVGGTRCTSRKALIRFFARLSQATHLDQATGGTSRATAIRMARSELDADGI